MRNHFGTVAVLAFVALMGCCRSFAAEPMLFRASGFVSPASEASLFSDRERQMVGMHRSFWHAKTVLITAFDASAIHAGTISLEMPDRKTYRFSGSMKELTAQGGPGYFSWTGISLPAGPASAASAITASERGAADRSGLDLVFDRGRTSVVGTLAIGDRRFTVLTVNAKYIMLEEDGLNPSTPPIDAEPTDQHQSRAPRSGRDWPPGLLSDKLRASLATSSIGAQLSPGSCKQVDSCGAATRISCNPGSDGPEMFFDNTTGALIMACGGACELGPGLPGSKRCTACPPPEWQRCIGNASKRPQR